MSDDYTVRNTIFIGQLSTVTTNTTFHAYERTPRTPFREILRGIEMSRNTICISPLKLWYTWEILHNHGWDFRDICDLCFSQKELLHSEFGGTLPYEEAQFFFSTEESEEHKPVSILVHIAYVRKTRQLTLVLPNVPVKHMQQGPKVIPLSDRVKK